ncbi:unnamed protein product [Psylliodes chrysocephalus]|uniref:CCHC-type domain-containing protein n=1 Tax=Psylliodes chrysocephalus TaxID=3402493 RepID=A0A9P0DBE2_9CUCU|nr:unnamed protein product [Psylliodes chrysocephala]
MGKNGNFQAKPTKKTMPPIVIDGKTKNQSSPIRDLKQQVKGEFSVKHTSATTIIFVDDREDHSRVINNIKSDNIPYHTYTANADKSHAFVLRGLADGTKIEDIENNLEEEHEIKARSIFQMKTKDRPLFLVVTDPAITLEYLNKNARRVLYTRVTWELRKSMKQIIQCHNCQQWGHATSNCEHIKAKTRRQINLTVSKATLVGLTSINSELSSPELGESSSQSSNNAAKIDTNAPDIGTRTSTDCNPTSITNTDIPATVQHKINNFHTDYTTSEDERGARGHLPVGDWYLPTSPNSSWNLRENSKQTQNMEIDKPQEQNKQHDLPFQTPRKFSSNFQRLIREKTKQTMTSTSNKYLPLSDESDSDLDDEIGKIVKRKRKNTPKDGNTASKNSENQPTQTTAPATTKKAPQNKTTPANNPKKPTMPRIVESNIKEYNTVETLINVLEKSASSSSEDDVEMNTTVVPKTIKESGELDQSTSNFYSEYQREQMPKRPVSKQKSTMPPIVIDGKTANPNQLIADLKAIVQGEFSVKHTNRTTILFVEGKDDYEKVLSNVKNEKMAYHTYTASSDKSHAFVLRGLADNTKIQDIKEDLEEDHEIIAREIYAMKTKERPLFLVVTDPVITLEYLNKNIRRILHTRVTWEIRKSVKQIIQCHTCQEWGHATAN